VIGSIRRECLDHVVIVNEAGLQRVLSDYLAYYLHSRTHLALDKDPPFSRAVAPPSAGRVVATLQVGGLHPPPGKFGRPKKCADMLKE
jgi:hypothetical protein